MYPSASEDSADINFELVPIKQELDTLLYSVADEPRVDPPDNVNPSESNQFEDTDIKFEEPVQDLYEPSIDLEVQLTDIVLDPLHQPISNECGLSQSVESRQTNIQDQLVSSSEIVQVHLKTELDGDKDSEVSDCDTLHQPISNECGLSQSVKSQQRNTQDQLASSSEIVQIHLKTELDWSLEDSYGDKDSEVSDCDTLHQPISNECGLSQSVKSQQRNTQDQLASGSEIVQIHFKTELDWSLEDSYGDKDSKVSDCVTPAHGSLQGGRGTCCGVCGKSFISEKSLTRHMLTHTGEKPYLCGQCGKSFRQSAHLAVHLLTHADDKPQTCFICGKSFKRRSYLQKHLLTHDPDLRKLMCEYCGKGFLRSDDLKRHVAGHDDERPYPCPICGKKFKQTTHLKGHLITHLNEGDFVCASCHKSFKTKEDLQKHDESHLEYVKKRTCPICGRHFTKPIDMKRHLNIHGDKRPHSCTICGKSFREKSHMKTHMETHEKDYSCEICEKSFFRRDCLRQHMVTHVEDEKKHCCEVCGKGFPREIKLKRHLIVHSDERPYECNLCDKKFKQKAHLKGHLSVHKKAETDSIGEQLSEDHRKHLCEICGKGFLKNFDLTRHMMMHYDLRPFSCEVCGKSFRQSSHLKGHMEVHVESELHPCEV